MLDGLEPMVEPIPHRICECGKRAYTSRAKARQAHALARFRIKAYQCDYNLRNWHVSNAEKAQRRSDF